MATMCNAASGAAAPTTEPLRVPQLDDADIRDEPAHGNDLGRVLARYMKPWRADAIDRARN
jgi:hypothetical protein